MKRRNDYSNTKVKTRNLLTNVSYRRFKQSDFNKTSFIVDILSFLVQNFNPINLDIKLDTEKEQDMIKFIWDECIPHEFVSFIYKHQKNYNQISRPNLTYQKANNIVKEYFFEDMNQINQVKYKIKEKFDLIHFIYLLLLSKIYNRTNSFGIEKKNNFDFNFQTWKTKKVQKRLSPMKVVSTAKDPANYEGRQVGKHEQIPVDIMLQDQLTRPTMVSSNVKDQITLKKQAEKQKC